MKGRKRNRRSDEYEEKVRERTWKERRRGVTRSRTAERTERTDKVD